MEIAEEFPAGDAVIASLNRVLVLYFIIFARGGNGPAVQRRDFSLVIEVEMPFAVMAAIGPEDFVDRPINLLHFSVGLDGENFFGVQQDGIRLFIMLRERRIGNGMHPGRSIIAADSRSEQARTSEQREDQRRETKPPGREFSLHWRQRLQVRAQSVRHHRSARSERRNARPGKFPWVP